jgi:DNA-binding MarR family transcriptional regulator
MNLKNKLFHMHKFYNLSRYLFLYIECNYNNIVESTSITLPQLRVLWIIKIFPSISLSEIAKIGFWSPPTVTKMLKILMDKNLVIREETLNKKLYSLNLTDIGNNLIKKNQRKKNDDFALLDLIPFVNDDKLNFAIEKFESIITHSNKTFIFEYINKINELNLKIDLSSFTSEDRLILKQLICLYNLLRTFILTVVSNHRKLLTCFNITYPQLRALWIIASFPGITSHKLSEIAFMSPSTSNVIVKNLYMKNLIYKEKSQLKNSLYLHISESGKELLIKDFEENQKSFLIYKNIDFLSTSELLKLNEFLLEMNLGLKNNIVEDYIEKTFKILEKWS